MCAQISASFELRTLSSQVTVSSGGMLVMKLDPNNLQFESVRSFDGTFAYAQNKVCVLSSVLIFCVTI